MTDLRTQASWFNRVAELYDRSRPGYPEPLVDAVLEFAAVPAEGRVLEIGCGTGQATAGFARRGLRMVCLEPGPRLAELARRNLAGIPAVEVRCESFEDWPLEAQAFDLVIAARSLHWVPPEVRYAKSAVALRAGGVLATFRNSIEPGDAVVNSAIRQAAGLFGRWLLPKRGDLLRREFRRSPHFQTPVYRVFRWAQTYDAASYVAFLQTHHRFERAPQPARKGFLDKVEVAIREHGGSIVVNFATELLMARRGPKADWRGRLKQWLATTHS